MADRKKLSSSRLEHDPNILLRKLVTLALISVLLILFLTAYGIHRSSVEDVLRSAEDDSIRIGKVMVNQLYLYLFDGGEESISISSDHLALFDIQVRDFLHPFAIVKIKIFDRDGTIAYSTDKKIIGQKVEGNPRLARALNGGIDSHQETKENVVDLAEELLLDVDVVETYMPVKSLSDEVAGSFEIYLDVTRYREEITRRVTNSVSILAVILLGVFAMWFFVVKIWVRSSRRNF